VRTATILDSRQTAITRLGREVGTIDTTASSSISEYPVIPWTAGVQPPPESRIRPRTELEARLLLRLSAMAHESGLSLFAYLDELGREGVCPNQSSNAES
jgi:hypothetical protein